MEVRRPAQLRREGGSITAANGAHFRGRPRSQPPPPLPSPPTPPAPLCGPRLSFHGKLLPRNASVEGGKGRGGAPPAAAEATCSRREWRRRTSHRPCFPHPPPLLAQPHTVPEAATATALPRTARLGQVPRQGRGRPTPRAGPQHELSLPPTPTLPIHAHTAVSSTERTGVDVPASPPRCFVASATAAVARRCGHRERPAGRQGPRHPPGGRRSSPTPR